MERRKGEEEKKRKERKKKKEKKMYFYVFIFLYLKYYIFIIIFWNNIFKGINSQTHELIEVSHVIILGVPNFLHDLIYTFTC